MKVLDQPSEVFLGDVTALVVRSETTMDIGLWPSPDERCRRLGRCAVEPLELDTREAQRRKQ
jgi:hypothetical protein